MLAPPFFNQQYFDNDGTPLDGGFLYTYVSGTTTPQATYVDQAGLEANTNPIVLDAAGAASMWLIEGVEYTFVLKRADTTTVRTRDDVAGVASGGDAVTSVNTFTGAVTLTADDIAFTTGTSTTWFAGTDTTAALDSIITKVDDVAAGLAATSAASVSIADAGNLYVATTVEAALQEIGVKIPAQTGNSGKFLTTNGTTTSWGQAGVGTVSKTDPGYQVLPSGLIMQWGKDTASGTVTFPTPFTTACLNVMVTSTVNSAVTTAGSLTTTTFALGNVDTLAYWFAIGY